MRQDSVKGPIENVPLTISGEICGGCGVEKGLKVNARGVEKEGIQKGGGKRTMQVPEEDKGEVRRKREI